MRLNSFPLSLGSAGKFLLAAALLCGCSGADTAHETVSAEALAIAVQRAADAQERWEARERELQAAVDALRQENADLRAQLGLAESTAELAQLDAEQRAAEARRYQQGLDRAVGELNRVAGAAAARPMPSAEAPRPAARARVSTLGSPQVQILGDAILVTGRLWNAGEADAVGRYTVELLENGTAIHDRTSPLDVPARTDVSFSERFQVLLRDNVTYSARIRLDY